MKVFVLCECGYEEGAVEIVGAFTTYDKAVKERLHQMKQLDEEDLDWVWYDIQEVEVK